MSISEQKIIAGNGMMGTYTHQAFEKLNIKNTIYKNCASFEYACQNLAEGTVDYALLPVYNTTIGSVLPVEEVLTQYKFRKVNEIHLHIQHALIGCKGSQLGCITHVTSYPVALAQCKAVIKKYGLKQIPHANTAEAVIDVLHKKDVTLAAIGPIGAANGFEAEVLMYPCNDEPDNTTVFHLFKK